MIVLLFPGQGTQKVGMLNSFLTAFKSCQDVLSEIEDSISFSISKIIENGPIEELTKTNNAQMAIFTTSVLCLNILTREYGYDVYNTCKFLAGHSLGEYSALYASGALSLRDASRLVHARGNIMANAFANNSNQFSMTAILGLPASKIEPFLVNYKHGTNICVIGNDNSSTQVVLSGYKDAVNNVINELQNQFGSIRAIPLNTSGPFHSPIMAPAIIALEKFFCEGNVKFTAMKIPIISNVYAFPFDNTDQIQSELIRQMVSTVRWRESMEIIANDNEIDTIVEVAPGKILTSMFKREYNNANTFNLDTIDSIEKFMRYTQDNPTNTFEKFRN
ncbi:MAG: ACP S-malonyltransferase [Alphaproteobacteria bacterium]|nr:ACP S-malonyltransferase [Alphaproteobacteria bacterium]